MPYNFEFKIFTKLMIRELLFNLYCSPSEEVDVKKRHSGERIIYSFRCMSPINILRWRPLHSVSTPGSALEDTQGQPSRGCE